MRQSTQAIYWDRGRPARKAATGVLFGSKVFPPIGFRASALIAGGTPAVPAKHLIGHLESVSRLNADRGIIQSLR
ncbi:MAG TPA: hypothetical protein VGO68_09390 [Pyrinomonadaceae bacterium]|jgi:hypothetical protein|nr:hypothetical protein [Pyrinomonadaceae bacterium]